MTDENEISLQINKIVQLDMCNVALIKKYIALSFENNPDLAVIPDKMRLDHSHWEDIHNFQGYISACTCFLKLFNYLIDKADLPGNLVEIILNMIGTYNKNIRLRWQKTDTRDDTEKGLDDKLFTMDLSSGFPLSIQVILDNFCPAAQDDVFYSSWQLFCTELYAMMIFSKKARVSKYFKLARIKFVIMNLLDDVLEEFIIKSCDTGEIFEWHFCFCNIKKELNVADKSDLDMYEKICSYLIPEAVADLKNEELYVNGFEKTKELLSSIKDKELALNIARNLLIAEKYGGINEN